MKFRIASAALACVLLLTGSLYAMSISQINLAKKSQSGMVKGASISNKQNNKLPTSAEKPYIGLAFGGPDIVTYTGTPTEFNGTAITPNGKIIKYQWDFDGNGKMDYESATTGKTTYTFARPGQYKAAFRATDALGTEIPDSIVRVVVRGGKGKVSYVPDGNLERSNKNKVKKNQASFKKNKKITSDEENFLGLKMNVTIPSSAVQLVETSPALTDSVLPANGIKKNYIVMIAGSADTNFWNNVTYAYDMFHKTYAIPDSDIYLLYYGGLNPSGQNPNNMIDYSATKANVQTVFANLANIVDADDTLYVWVSNHGAGYLTPHPKGINTPYFNLGRISVDSGDEQDYLESSFKFRGLFNFGNYEYQTIGLNQWGTVSYYSLGKNYYYRHKYVSHFDNVNFTKLGTKSDNDIYIEEIIDYLKGDSNKDGIIDTSAGETMDSDNDGIQPYNSLNNTYDEDEWDSAPYTYNDNIDPIYNRMPEGFQNTYTAVDIGLDDHLDIDLSFDPANPHIDGTDVDNDGIFDNMDANDDGDFNDWISIDEASALYDGLLYDDELRDYLQQINPQKTIFLLQPCFSGGFINDLSGTNRIIMAATEETNYGWGDLFINNITSALSGSTNSGSSYEDPSTADANSDGVKDMKEIFNFASQWDIGTYSEIPQYDDNGDGLSHAYPLPNGEDGNFGSTISLVATPPAPIISGSVQINSGTAYTKSTYVVLNLTASSGVSRMQFSNNGTTYTALEKYATTKSWILPAGPGSKTVYVKFVNSSGVSSSAYYDSIILDTAAPTVYAPQTTSPTENKSPVWTWSAAKDGNSGPSGQYKFYLGTMARGNQLVNAQVVTGNTFTYPASLAYGTYYAYVTTTDNAGNLAVSSVSPVIIKDMTAPITSITSPTENSIIPKNKTIVIQATAGDANGVKKVTFLVNGLTVCIDVTDPYVCNWRVPNQSGRTYKLQTNAYDAAGNIGRSAVVNVTPR